ncbi:MAG TPA: ATP-binding protein [Candidatus Acidoferrum sp.]|nr:ATP-binding protein [Candidatus Acidoferrum sp.]
MPVLLASALPRHQTALPYPWLFFAMTGVIFLGVLVVTIVLLRRTLASSAPAGVEKDSIPRADNEPAFLTASMQAVIQRLREQEKELERLHKIERDRAENTARFSEEVTRNMPAGLLVIGANGLISSSNPAAELALGTKALAFRRYSEVLGESSRLSGLIAQCLHHGTVFRREQAAHIAPDGTQRELGVTISPIRRDQEKATGAICLLSDLTELATLQKQMQLRENLAALGELSAGIAHEFKNALATISGYAQMIHADPSAPDTPENAGKILDQTRNVTHVVTEFLRYARPLDIAAEPVSLGPLIERAVSEIEELFPQVRFVTEGEFAEVAGDDGLLRQVLLNLVRNAAEAAATAAEPSVSVVGQVLGPNREQRVTVRDNGAGIAPEALPKLFLPFFTTKANGTGLGLAIVQKILLQHGGQIEARNRFAGGAEFILTLPATRQVPEAVESKEVAI